MSFSATVVIVSVLAFPSGSVVSGEEHLDVKSCHHAEQEARRYIRALNQSKTYRVLGTPEWVCRDWV